MLLTITITDIKRMEIDNEPLILGLVFIVFYSICGFDNLTIANRIYGFWLGGLIFYLLAIIGSMGGGDIKLMFVIGYFIGLRLTIISIYFSFVIGALIGIWYLIKKKKKLNSNIPFGPAISLGTIITILFF